MISGSMQDREATGLWGAADADVAQACALLLSAAPGDLDRCEPLLARAVERIRAAPAAMAAGQDKATRQALRALRRRVLRAGRLLDTAAEYRLQWMRRLETMSNTYTVRGEPGPIDLGGHVRVRG